MATDDLPTVPGADSAEDLRQRAVRRIKEKYDFRVHLVVYLAVNLMLVAIWAFTGNALDANPGVPLDFFWPIFPMLGWGVGVVAHGYTVYRGDVYSESAIQSEMHRLSR